MPMSCLLPLPLLWIAERGIQTRRGDQRPGHLLCLAAPRLQSQRRRGCRQESSGKLHVPIQRLAHPTTHVLSDRPRELTVLPELTVQPRRREFEIVRRLDEPGDIQHVPGLPAHGLAIGDRDTSRLVYE